MSSEISWVGDFDTSELKIGVTETFRLTENTFQQNLSNFHQCAQIQ